jgi:hypothetical protein
MRRHWRWHPFSTFRGFRLIDTTQRRPLILRAKCNAISRHPRCIPHHRHFLPFIHFALHANRAGILVGGTSLIEWRDLLTILSPLRERLEGNLLISMSACHGFYGYRLACSFERFTYHFLVGTRVELDWRDTVLAYHVFYHSLFFRKVTLPRAVAAMNSSLLSRGYSFDYTFGSEVQQRYKRFFTQDESIVAARNKAKRVTPRYV